MNWCHATLKVRHCSCLLALCSGHTPQVPVSSQSHHHCGCTGIGNLPTSLLWVMSVQTNTPHPHTCFSVRRKWSRKKKKGFTRSASCLFSTVPCSRCSSWAWLQCDILSAPGRKCEEQPPRTNPPRVVLPWFGSPLTFCLLEGGIMSKESDCRQLTSRSHKFL